MGIVPNGRLSINGSILKPLESLKTTEWVELNEYPSFCFVLMRHLPKNNNFKIEYIVKNIASTYSYVFDRINAGFQCSVVEIHR